MFNAALRPGWRALTAGWACVPRATPGRPAARRFRWAAWLAVALVCLGQFPSARAQDVPNRPLSIKLSEGLTAGPQSWTSPEGLSSTIEIMLLLTVLSMAPAILLMTTCFVRLIVVLSLLRQAIGTQTLPPSQVITAIALFITLAIMTPVWTQVYQQAIVPYTAKQISLEQAWTAGAAPIRKFMSIQIKRCHNDDDIWLFMSYLPKQAPPKSYDDVPLAALLPAFMLSELKTSFLIGFTIYLPFMIIDMVVSSVLVAMGMLMLPPTTVSLPLKLLLFVLVNGWHLVVKMLMDSFQGFS
jgi:flagellar biosynthetic protein FliP